MVVATSLAAASLLDVDTADALSLCHRDLNSGDLVASALVVDQGSWAELADRQEARALEVVATVGVSGALAHGRDVSREWQPREGVAGQEALGGEVAVGVEVGVASVVLVVLQEPKLVLGL